MATFLAHKWHCLHCGLGRTYGSGEGEPETKEVQLNCAACKGVTPHAFEGFRRTVWRPYLSNVTELRDIRKGEKTDGTARAPADESTTV
jgi:hypothetical protein